MIYLFLSLITFMMASCSGNAPENSNVSHQPTEMVSKQKTEKSYRHIKDVVDEKIGILMNSALEQQLNNRYKDIHYKRYESDVDLLYALQKGDCTAVGLDDYVLPYYKQLFGSIATLDDVVAEMELGAAFPKDQNIELRQQFNAFLKKAKEDGLIDRIMEKWIFHSDTATLPKMKLPTKGEPIKVGISTENPPSALPYFKTNTGFDVEILMYFSQYINRPIVRFNYILPAIIPAVTSGKVDFTLSGITITEERKKFVDFSDPFWKYNMLLVVNEKDKAGFVPPTTAKKDTEWSEEIIGSFENNIIKEQRYMLIVDGFKTTVMLSLFSAILGTIIGCGICYLRMQKSKAKRNFAKIYISVVRAIPVLVLLLFMSYVVFTRSKMDACTIAIITFSINLAAYVSEIFRQAIESVNKGQLEAGEALGFSKFQAFLYIVFPQALKNGLTSYKDELISLTRNTSIVGYIAVDDLTKVSDTIRACTFDALFPLIMVTILYAIIAWLFGAALDLIGRLIIKSYKTKQQ